MSSEQILLLPLWYVVFLLSVTCHEAAHAWAALRGGDSTAYLGGQVTLNPLPHVQREMWGTVLFPLLSYASMGWMMGWASAPYDPHWEARHPRRAAAMAAAGPAANLLLAAVGFFALKVGVVWGTWGPELTPSPDLGWVILSPALDQLVVPTSEAAAGWSGVSRFCSVLLSLNLVLFLFNLMPFPPMDGASVLAGLSPPYRRLRDRLRANPMSSLVGLIVAMMLFGRVFRPVFRVVLGWLYL